MATRPRWRQRSLFWVLAALVTGVGVLVLAFGFRSGECIDYVSGAGTCSSGPAVGIYGAWALAGVAALLASYFLYKAFAGAHRQTPPSDTESGEG